MIVESHAVLVGLSAVILFAFTLGGLAILRIQKGVATRTLLFLVFCFASVSMTLWVAKSGRLFVAEVAVAWLIALLLVGAIETGRVRRRKQV